MGDETLAAPISLLVIFDFYRFCGKYEIFIWQYIPEFYFLGHFFNRMQIAKICLSWWRYQKIGWVLNAANTFYA